MEKLENETFQITETITSKTRKQKKNKKHIQQIGI